jgi:hypothetical protein
MESLGAVAARLLLLPRKTFGGPPGPGLSHLSLRRAGSALALLATVAVAVGGCGGGEGVSEGATVSVYAVAPACAGAKQAQGRQGARVGEVRVRLVCVRDGEDGKAWTLAAVGANARRATEDSTTVAYIADRDPTAARFSRSILESTGIAQLPPSPSGAAAMAKLLDAIAGAGNSGSIRESVDKSLSSG